MEVLLALVFYFVIWVLVIWGSSYINQNVVWVESPVISASQKEGASMSYFQRTNQRKDGPDWGFLGFIITITALAVAAALIQIYLQNPKWPALAAAGLPAWRRVAKSSAGRYSPQTAEPRLRWAAWPKICAPTDGVMIRQLGVGLAPGAEPFFLANITLK
jgi:hypothetical protein